HAVRLERELQARVVPVVVRGAECKVSVVVLLHAVQPPQDVGQSQGLSPLRACGRGAPGRTPLVSALRLWCVKRLALLVRVVVLVLDGDSRPGGVVTPLVLVAAQEGVSDPPAN